MANLKPYFHTQSRSDRIDVLADFRGNDFSPQELRGVSPGGEGSLVAAGDWIPMGWVQAIRPKNDGDTLRLRFTAPAGEMYGPRNLGMLSKIRLPFENLRLNPQAHWCRWLPKSDVDPRDSPAGNYFPISDDNPLSLGLVDDLSDGFVECSLAGIGLIARARVVVSPPDFAPDRRHLVSFADGLSDRIKRAEVYNDTFYAEVSELEPGLTKASAEIRDLMERILETLSTINLEATANRVDTIENVVFALQSDRSVGPGDHLGLTPPIPTKEQPFPLTDAARELHRQFVVLDIFRHYVHQHEKELRTVIRPPFTGDPMFDRKMPALMRGSGGGPLHLTRRQYDMLFEWAKRLGLR
jgi:hypothetical protein